LQRAEQGPHGGKAPTVDGALSDDGRVGLVGHKLRLLVLLLLLLLLVVLLLVLLLLVLVLLRLVVVVVVLLLLLLLRLLLLLLVVVAHAALAVEVPVIVADALEPDGAAVGRPLRRDALLAGAVRAALAAALVPRLQLDLAGLAALLGGGRLGEGSLGLGPGRGARLGGDRPDVTAVRKQRRACCPAALQRALGDVSHPLRPHTAGSRRPGGRGRGNASSDLRSGYGQSPAHGVQYRESV
jgi:hypothetical protein